MGDYPYIVLITATACINTYTYLFSCYLDRCKKREIERDEENTKNNQQQFITCIDLATSIMINLAEY